MAIELWNCKHCPYKFCAKWEDERVPAKPPKTCEHKGKTLQKRQCQREDISLEANTSSDSHLWMFQSTVTSGIIFISIMYCKKERKFFYDFD